MKTTALLLFISLLAPVPFSACSKPEPEDDPIIIAIDNEEYEPIVLTKAEQELNQASNEFGFDVYHKIYSGDDMLISPLSLSLALSMTANGAAGTTEKEMLSTLGFAGKDKETMNNYYQKMIGGLLAADSKTTFEVANSIWADGKIGVKKSFTDATTKYYSSEVYPADFSTQATVDQINKWCYDKTHGKIPSIMDKPDPDLVMALINALYFKGEWAFAFNEKTKKEDFATLGGSKNKVDMMSAEDKLLYAEYDGFSMVQLPYGNGAFCMDVILPAKNEDFAKAAARFDAKTFDGLIGNRSNAIVNLKLPKFTFEYNTTLNNALIALGMETAFSNDKADFSEIADKPLKISVVKQKTFIDVNEKGTEAAAVTFIGVATTSVGPSPQPKIVDFFADRPFLFIIRENSTGAVLFIGQKVK